MKNLQGVIVAIMGVILVASPTQAETYELTQEIYGPRCSHEKIETADQQNDAECPMFGPFVARHRSDDGRLYIEGVYDAVHARELTVWFDTRRYQAGKEPALTVHANRWTLIIDQPPVGSYDVRVVMLDQANRSFESARYPIQIGGSLTDFLLPSILPFLASTGSSIVLSVLVALCLVGGGLWLRHKASRPKDDSS